MKHFFSVLFIAGTALFANGAYALDRQLFDQQIKHLQNEEYAPIETFLDDNKKSMAKDPDYYVILLNYVMSKGHSTLNVVGSGEARPGELQITDPKTGESVGFIGQRTQMDEEFIVNGFRRTQKALKHFNNRLDIHFGIIAMAEKLPRWDIVGEQCVEVLKVSRQIDNQWIWGPINSMDGEPKEFMINNILNRTNKLFYAQTPDADIALKKVSEELVRQYPELIYGYANLGVFYLVQGRYELAEKYLKQAERIDPKDEIVQGNLKELKKRRAGKK